MSVTKIRETLARECLRLHAQLDSVLEQCERRYYALGVPDVDDLRAMGAVENAVVEVRKARLDLEHALSILGAEVRR